MSDPELIEALVVVHSDSLAAYAFEGGNPAPIAAAILDALRRHTGPRLIVHQGWDTDFTRRFVRTDPGVAALEFDEATQSWFAFGSNLVAWLRARGVTHVRLAGAWFHRKGSGGCVNQSQRILERAGFTVHVDPALVGCWDDLPPATTTGAMPDFSAIRTALEPRAIRAADWLPSDQSTQRFADPLPLEETMRMAQRIPPLRRAAAMAIALRRVRLHIPAILEETGFGPQAAEQLVGFFQSAEASLTDNGPRIAWQQAPTGPIITLSHTVENAIINWPQTVHLKMLVRATVPSQRLRWRGLRVVVVMHAHILAAWRLGLLQTLPAHQAPFRQRIPRAIAAEVMGWWDEVAVWAQ